jgi:hypothetical protein
MDEKLLALLAYGFAMIAVAVFSSFMADRQKRREEAENHQA